MSCPSCGHENPAGARFCNDCGAPLAAPTITPEPRSYTPRHLAEKILASQSALRGERKLVTVLFADVARSMELAERVDPEEWHRLLDRLFRILAGGIHRYEGTINQYTGDGIMALFGAPIAHEDHAQRACAAALDLARELGALAEDVRRESGLEFENHPLKKGFGIQIIERSLPHIFAGSSTLTLHPDGVEWLVEFPLRDE